MPLEIRAESPPDAPWAKLSLLLPSDAEAIHVKFSTGYSVPQKDFFDRMVGVMRSLAPLGLEIDFNAEHKHWSAKGDGVLRMVAAGFAAIGFSFDPKELARNSEMPAPNAASSSSGSRSSAPWPMPGVQVWISGVVSHPALNGRVATIQGPAPATLDGEERWQVACSGALYTLRRSRLAPVESAPKAQEEDEEEEAMPAQASASKQDLQTPGSDLARSAKERLRAARDLKMCVAIRSARYEEVLKLYTLSYRQLRARQWDAAAVQKNIAKVSWERALLDIQSADESGKLENLPAGSLYSYWIPEVVRAVVLALEHGASGQKEPAWLDEIGLFLCDVGRIVETQVIHNLTGSARTQQLKKLLAALSFPEEKVTCPRPLYLFHAQQHVAIAIQMFKEVQGLIDHSDIDKIVVGGDRTRVTSWIQAKQLLHRIDEPVSCAWHCLDSGRLAPAECRSLRDELLTLEEQRAFLHRRSELVVSLWQALCQHRSAFLDQEELDVEGMFQAFDDLRYVLMLAGGNPNGQAAAVDIEACCVAMHELAKLHEVALHNTERAYALHLETIRLAHSLTTESVEEEVVPQGLLSAKRWFMGSWKHVYKARQKRQEEMSKKHAEELKAIAPELGALREAINNFSLKDFLAFLYDKHPPRSGRKLPADLQSKATAGMKRVLLETIREYSPSNQAQYFQAGGVPREWELLCTEIQKMLNSKYEANYKSSTDSSATAEEGDCNHEENRRSPPDGAAEAGEGEHSDEAAAGESNGHLGLML